MMTLAEDTMTTTEKILNWDGEFIEDLIEILKVNDYSNTLVQDENPVPIVIRKMFPSVIAIDNQGQCLLSRTDWSIKHIRDLYSLRSRDELVKDIYVIDHIPEVGACDPVAEKLGLLAGFLIPEKCFAYSEWLIDSVILFRKAPNVTPGNSLPRANEPTIWQIYTIGQPVKSGSAPTLQVAINQAFSAYRPANLAGRMLDDLVK